MDFRFLYTSFEGRIGRKQFWLAGFILMLVSVLAVVTLDAVAGFLSFVVYLALLYPGIALGVKRLHDRSRPARLMAVFVVPGLLSQLGTVLGLTSSPQDFGGQVIDMPNTLGWILGLLSMVVSVWALVELGFLKGVAGENEHGPDPLRRLR